MMIEKTQRMNLLLDLYGKLLTKHQEEISLLYYSENLSLQEIADNYNISRNAVFDTLKKSESLLEEYEAKMGLLKDKNQNNSDYCVVVTVTDDEKVADKIINKVIGEKLAASAQKSEIASTYWWQGKIVYSKEILVQFKTRKECYETIKKIILKNHNYKLPEISFYEMTGYDKFLNWISEETR